MNSWTFINADSGQELCARLQLTTEQAHALAEEYAKELDCGVDYIEHETGDEYDSYTPPGKD